MKIIDDNVVYVQRKDIIYLVNNALLPNSISIKTVDDYLIIDNAVGDYFIVYHIVRDHFKNIEYIDNSDKYDFVEFNDPKIIEFFKGTSWIIDYNEVKDLNEEEIIALEQSTVEDQKAIAQKISSLSKEEKELNDDMVLQYSFLEYKIYSLRDVLWFKQGKITMELPEVHKDLHPKKEKGIIRLMKTIFNKKETK